MGSRYFFSCSINTSETFTFTHKIEDLEFLMRFKSESKMTEEDALKLGEELSKKLAKRYTE